MARAPSKDSLQTPPLPLVPFTDFDSITPQTNLQSLNLNWTERDLPERVRTKHVHRLHPYLGKFIPQLAEIFLRKYQPTLVCDPFSGSGTTLVQAIELGIRSVGCDISEFNCMLTRVKTAKYDLELLDYEIHDIVGRAMGAERLAIFEPRASYGPEPYLQQWFHPNALRELESFRSLIRDYRNQETLQVILSRAARSARQTTHFDLDFPKRPQTEPYYCYKHSRICKPTTSAAQFLKRYSLDTLRRIKEFAGQRDGVPSEVIHGDARNVAFPHHDLVLTSPPYVGLIDYHEQHRYAYELLGLPMSEDQEIGPASRGNSGRAKQEYVEDMAAVFGNLRQSLDPDGTVVIVVNDKFDLYGQIAEKAGFRCVDVLRRHVNRRTGRRADDFYESILIWERERE